jgi:hypothetical protein
MRPADLIVKLLRAQHWHPLIAELADVDVRLVYHRRDGVVELEHLPARGELRLWLRAGGERRCLMVRYGEVLARIIELQAELSPERYLVHRRELDAVASVTLGAWSDGAAQPAPAATARRFQSLELEIDPALLDFAFPPR